jgi:hypothetical protein
MIHWLLILASWIILILVYGILPAIGVASLIVDALPSQKLGVRVGIAIAVAVGFVVFVVYLPATMPKTRDALQRLESVQRVHGWSARELRQHAGTAGKLNRQYDGLSTPGFRCQPRHAVAFRASRRFHA